MWLERGPEGVRAVHILRNTDGRILHERRKADEVQYLTPTGVKSTPKEFEDHLRLKLMANGGNFGAYEHLGVEKPEVEAVASAETQAAHHELYLRASRLLKISEAELIQKYGHLNPGLQAMNLRNRLRKAGHNV